MKMAAVILLGIFLAIPCVFKQWTEPTYPSIKPWPSGTEGVGPYRPVVDEWSWTFLNYWYGNSEDGVSGQQAWIWKDGKLVTYASTFPSWMPQCIIAAAWSIWRNNANNYKRPSRQDSLNKPWIPSANPD